MTLEVWRKTELGPLLDILSGFAFKSEYFASSDKSGLPLIRIRDLVTHDPETRYTGEYDDRFLISRSEILIGMDGDFCVCRWKGPDSLLNQRVCRVTSSDSDALDDGFLFYRLQPELTAIQRGIGRTTVKHLSTKNLKTLNLMLPPVTEQRKIAAILSSVDNAIEKTQAVIDQVQVVKRGLMQELLTRGLPGRHTRFKQTRIGKVPEAWQVLPAINVLSDKPRNGRSPRARTTPPGVPTFSIAAVREGRVDVLGNLKYVDLTDEEADAFRLRQGDLLVVRGNANEDFLGRCGVVDGCPPGCIYPDILMRLSPNETIVPRYLAHLWNSDTVHSQLLSKAKTTSGTLKINQHDVSTVLVPLSELEEQSKIVEIAGGLDNSYSWNSRLLEAYRHLKDGLTSVLLTGELRVTPDTEAA